jgi:hypothetical protein
MAQDDASLVRGWNIAPNLAYVLRLLPGSASCGVLLYDETGATLVASGAALVGTEQPCVLIPQTGQTVSMVDDALGWHLLLTTTGTESQRTVRIGPMVDLPDEIHPVYGGDDDMALARATAAIDEGAHYRDDVTVTCPLGLGAGLGDTVSVPVGDETVTGQVESITWTATPDGASDLAVIRRHVAIAPEAFVEPVPPTPPTLAADTASTDADTDASGNVLDNDDDTLTVVAVNGLSGNVGSAVAGSAGGLFTINSDGSWVFDPDGDFDEIEEDTDTAVTYYASDGEAEAMATLTVTVSAATPSAWTPEEITTSLWLDADDASTITLADGKVERWYDKSGNDRTLFQFSSSYQPIVTAAGQSGLDVVTFDGSDFMETGVNFPETGDAEFSMFWVHKKTSANNGSVFGWGLNNTLQACGFYDSGSVAGIAYANGNTYKCDVPTTGETNVWAYVKSAGAIDTTSTLTKDGADAGTTGHSTSTPNIASGLFRLGQWGAYTSARLIGSIAELVICQSNLSESVRQKVEGYLAHKWGLADSLPADHPYKSAAPTI